MGGHHHSHGLGDEDHDHGLAGGWGAWLQSGQLRIVLVGLLLAGLGAVLGLVLMWPDGSGSVAATEAAEEIGLATERLRATVVSSENAACSYSTIEQPQDCRLLSLDVLEGPDAGSVVALPEINLDIERGLPELNPGDTVLLGFARATNTYFYDDIERTTPIVILGILFVVIVIAFGRFRGALALIAMATTVAVLVGFVAPSVLDGNDPILVALVAATVIAFVSLFLTHGFTPTTAVALAGTLAALGLTFVLSWFFFDMARFSGFASGESLVLSVLAQDVRISSLLLGGAVIGALGALDDVTVTQVSTVAELKRSNPSLTAAQLVTSGIRVGRDHIAATVNTLLLAYAGASMPILLLFSAFDQSIVTVSSTEIVAVEIIRTLCGSIGLIAAVPLTTILAAAVVTSEATPVEPGLTHEHSSDEHSQDHVEAADNELGAPSWDDFAPKDIDPKELDI